jgi:hypothetical protein
MTRKQNKRAERRRLRRRERVEAPPYDLIADTAAVYTCGAELSRDYAQQCRNNREALEADVVFTRLAHELWQGRPGRAELLAAALGDLAAERQRHLEAITELGKRFDALVEQSDFHEHLGPSEAFRELVHRRLFPEEFTQAR